MASLIQDRSRWSSPRKYAEWQLARLHDLRLDAACLPTVHFLVHIYPIHLSTLAYVIMYGIWTERGLARFYRDC